MMAVKSHAYEIERIEWLLANGYPRYALWRCLKLLIRQRKEWIALKCNNAIVYAYLYKHHVWLELSIRQQLPIIWDFIAGRFRRASPLTRPERWRPKISPPTNAIYCNLDEEKWCQHVEKCSDCPALTSHDDKATP